MTGNLTLKPINNQVIVSLLECQTNICFSDLPFSLSLSPSTSHNLRMSHKSSLYYYRCNNFTFQFSEDNVFIINNNSSGTWIEASRRPFSPTFSYPKDPANPNQHRTAKQPTFCLHLELTAIEIQNAPAEWIAYPCGYRPDIQSLLQSEEEIET